MYLYFHDFLSQSGGSWLNLFSFNAMHRHYSAFDDSCYIELQTILSYRIVSICSRQNTNSTIGSRGGRLVFFSRHYIILLLVTHDNTTALSCCIVSLFTRRIRRLLINSRAGGVGPFFFSLHFFLIVRTGYHTEEALS